MADLSSKIIKYLNREVDFTKDVLLSDDMINGVSNPYIKEWNVEEAQPTNEQLNALKSQATTLENNNKIRDTRRAAYGDIGDQLDLLYKDIVANKLDTTGEWAKKIKAVKDANAKEE